MHEQDKTVAKKVVKDILVPHTTQIISWRKFFPKRNQMCPCGSGLKFKKCCLPKIQSGEIKVMGGF